MNADTAQWEGLGVNDCNNKVVISCYFTQVSFATVQTVEKLLFSESEEEKEDILSPSGSSSPELGDITHPNRPPSIVSYVNCHVIV